MSDQPESALPDISDSVSVLSSNVGARKFPDISISAYIEDASEEKFFMGTLDTGAQVNVISEHAVVNRWSRDRIDSTKSRVLNDLGLSGVRTLGTIRITLRLAAGVKELNASFHVVPTSDVKYRFDALLSDSLIERRGILVLNPPWRKEEEEEATDSEDEA
jgi:hypothetical protein